MTVELTLIGCKGKEPGEDPRSHGFSLQFILFPSLINRRRNADTIYFVYRPPIPCSSSGADVTPKINPDADSQQPPPILARCPQRPLASPSPRRRTLPSYPLMTRAVAALPATAMSSSSCASQRYLSPCAALPLARSSPSSPAAHGYGTSSRNPPLSACHF